MDHFTALRDVGDIAGLVREARRCKEEPLARVNLGRGRTLGLLFFNSSLRTRMSTWKAAQNLGLQVLVLNVGTDGWALEMRDGVVMDGDRAEHIRDAAAVMGQYCDILGLRAFPGLQDREADYNETVLNSFLRYSGVPVINLESATRHPLQSLADLLTIEEHKRRPRPKVVLTWVPHPRALPQAVANSFCEWMRAADVEFVLTHPPGYELAEEFTAGVQVEYDQNRALENADFVYAKNWSAYRDYGAILSTDRSWMISEEKMARTRSGKFMHCLPVRRNVVVTDAVLDGPDSLIYAQAANRVWAAQAVLQRLLHSMAGTTNG